MKHGCLANVLVAWGVGLLITVFLIRGRYACMGLQPFWLKPSYLGP